MFVYKKNPVRIELFSHVETSFYSKQFAKLLTTWLKTIYRFDKQTTTLHVHHTFLQCKLLCRQCTNTTWKCLISRFMEDVNKPRRGFLFPSELGYVSKEFNSRGVRLHKSKWVEMIAKKIEGTLWLFERPFRRRRRPQILRPLLIRYIISRHFSQLTRT